MRRRDFINGITGSFAAWPFAALAQPTARPVIGFLNSSSPETYVDRINSFRDGLKEAGYVDGSNARIEFRWAENRFERLPELAKELVSRQVAVIATASNLAAAKAALAATATIPIVFATGADPVRTGLVASLNHPGGNITGVTILADDLVPKQLELVQQVVPTVTGIALLVNPTNQAAADVISKDAQAAAERMRVHLYVVHASEETEFDKAIADVRRLHADGLVITPDSLFFSRGAEIAALALRSRLASISPLSDYPISDGLMSYGGSVLDQFHQVGIYTGRILNGEKVADLPVFQTTKVEMTINLKTAKVLGITVPLPLLGRADRVIE